MKRTKNKIDEHKNLIFNHRFQCFHSQVSLHLIFGWELPISAVNFGG